MSNILTSNILNASIVTILLTTPAVAANTVVTQAYTVPGVNVGDTIAPEPVALVANLLVTDAVATAANTVTVQFANPTATPVSAGASPVNFQFICYKTDAVIGSARS
jgi:hypothetical protein